MGEEKERDRRGREEKERDRRQDRDKEEEERREKEKSVRERRCFVCNIFRHMAQYCRNRGEKEGPAQVSLNRFEVLKDRVMQRGEGSGK